MTEVIVKGRTLTEAYHKALFSLYYQGEYVNNSKECAMTICIEHPLEEPMISRCFIGGPYDLERYRQEMLDGILDFEVEKGNWVYTYHSRYAPYIDFIVEELQRDPYSRRAIVSVRDNEVDSNTDDPACLQSIQFMIRHGKLDCFVLFRSNDAAKASYMNMYALIRLQERIAQRLGVPVGTYTHRANSYHVYNKDFDMFESYVKRIADDYQSTIYNYKGDWDELMEEEKSEVARLVKQLKG